VARRPPGALERSVLGVLRSAARPMTVAEVAGQLDGEPAYTTVMTTLVRLHDKGALVRQARGRGFAYFLAVDEDDLTAAQTARRMRRLLDGEGQRADVLTRFVAELGPEDERLLLEVLRGAGPSHRPDEQR
jgi:predicted transcriptional regulator